MTERTGLAFAATLLALAILQVAAVGASARGYEDMTRLEQRIAEFASRGGGHRQPRLDRRLRLSGCDVLPELLWYGTGESTVLVRCGGPESWQIYVPVVVAHDAPAAAAQRNGTVVVTRPVPRGAALTAADLKVEPATAVPGGVSDIGDVTGKIAVRALNPGEPVRATLIVTPPAVKRGDPVIIKTGSLGFEISAEGVAEQDGAPGSRIKVKNAASGGRVQAIVGGPGIVFLPGYKNARTGRE